MEAVTPWTSVPVHSPCPVCARRTVPDAARPSVRRAADGLDVDADVLRGDSLTDAGIELDEVPDTATDIVAIRIPRLSRDDVMQLSIPRACMVAAPAPGDERAWVVGNRPAHSVVLPPQWYLLEASLPTIVSRTSTGCTRIEFDAPADESADVVLTIVRHSLATAV